jgi:hypothetical protein
MQNDFKDVDAVFISSTVAHLTEARDVWKRKEKLHLMLASWGYTNDEHMALAQSSGYKVLTEDEFTATVSH